MLDQDMQERTLMRQAKSNNYVIVDKQTGFDLIQLISGASDKTMETWISPQKPFPNVFWTNNPKEAWVFEDGFIVLDLKDLKKDLNLQSFDPLEQKDLLNDFQAIGYDFRITELEFVKKYGLLGYMAIENARSPYLYLNSFNNTGGLLSIFIEPLAWFRRQQEEYLALADIYECITKNPEPSLVMAHHKYLFENADRLFTDTDVGLSTRLPFLLENLHSDDEFLLWLELTFMEILKDKLKPIRLSLTRAKKPDLKFGWGYTSAARALIESIYFMFWREVTRQTELKTCLGCRTKFFVKSGKGRKPKYHSVLCEEAAKRRRYRKGEE